MNDIRRTILWVIFGFSMVLLWDKWQLHNGKRATFFPAPVTASAEPPVGEQRAVDVPVAGAGASASSAAAGVPSAVVSQVAAPAQRERVELVTDVLRLVFDSEGGSLVRAELLQHADLVEKDKKFMMFDESAQRVYVAQTGLIGGDFPTHKTIMSVAPGARALKDGENELNVRFESPDLGGIKMVKTWTVKRGAYDIAVRHEVVNTGTAPVAPKLYLQLVRDGNKPAGESSFYSTFTGPAVFTQDKKYQKVDFEDIKDNKADFAKESDNGYVAMVQHYFASAWLLPEGAKREFFMRKVDANLYSAGMLTAFDPIAPGASKALEARLFAGPQVETSLEKLAPGLELV